MKTLYLDCGMGAAGDMLAAALIELLPEPAAFIKKLNGLGIPGVEFSAEKCIKHGVSGVHVTVKVNGAEEESLDEHHEDHTHHHDLKDLHHLQEHIHLSEHVHEHDHDHNHNHDHDNNNLHHHDEHNHGHLHGAGMSEIGRVVAEMNISENVKKDVMDVYKLIAEAESHAHGVPVNQVHFHELGALDAVADITAVCLLMNELAPDEVVVSPVHVGCGHVRCAHGILPVPAPATAYILKNVPIYGGKITGELCTPTGAALLKHFATRFGEMPVMETEAIGYGMGKKDFEAINCVRAMIGSSMNAVESVLKLSFNVDDMTAEEIGFAAEQLFDGGARDVFTLPVGMKKSRPGTLVCILCDEKDREKMLGLIFKHTSTIGVREETVRRHTLSRRFETVNSEFGDVKRKISEGYGVRKSKYEYDDLAKIARENGMSLEEVRGRLG